MPGIICGGKRARRDGWIFFPNSETATFEFWKTVFHFEVCDDVLNTDTKSSCVQGTRLSII